jgi:hypothetical protein
MNDTNIEISTSDEINLVEHPEQPKTIRKPNLVSNKTVHQVEPPKLDLNLKSRVEQKPLF